MYNMYDVTALSSDKCELLQLVYIFVTLMKQ